MCRVCRQGFLDHSKVPAMSMARVGWLVKDGLDGIAWRMLCFRDLAKRGSEHGEDGDAKGERPNQ